VPADSPRSAPFRWRSLPPTVVVLGFVSLLMDTSSELIHGLLPVFLVTVLGASASTVGFIEGFAEATAAVSKVFSGVVSDWIGRRKALTAIGYGMAAASKALFPFANTVGTVLFARFVDRIGKGVRDAPRDALIADVTPSHLRGAAYGLRQALDTVGAVLGPLLAMALMFAFAGDFRAVFWWAVPPAALAVLLIVFGVREPDRPQGAPDRRKALRLADLALLPAVYWWVVAIGAVFTLARFSEAFLILRANGSGLPIELTPLVLVAMNAVYAVVVAPAGALSDRIGRNGLLLLGMGVLIVADLVVAFLPSLPAVFIGVGLWGAHLGLTQGLLAALVADAAPADRRGTAFGVFNLVSGGVLLIASFVAGVLWDWLGAGVTFGAGAAFAAAAALMLLATWNRTAAAANRRD
jgi:MFS family permease